MTSAAENFRPRPSDSEAILKLALEAAGMPKEQSRSLFNFKDLQEKRRS